MLAGCGEASAVQKIPVLVQGALQRSALRSISYSSSCYSLQGIGAVHYLYLVTDENGTAVVLL